MNIFEKLFSLEKYGTNIRTEILSGCTTFMSMVFIIFVNPVMLSESGIPLEAAFTATILASVLPTFIMGFFANLPIALAPGMGVNAFFTYTLVQGMGLNFENALAAVFLSGFLFLGLALFNIPQYIINAIPDSLKISISVGIGFFIALIGFQNTGITISNESTMLGLGDLGSSTTLLGIFGLIFTAVLMAKKVRGSLLWGILAITVFSMLLGLTPLPKSFNDIVSTDIPSLSSIFFKLDFSTITQASFISVILSMALVDLFNAMGTIIGLAPKADMIDDDKKIRGLKRAMIADSSGTLIGSLLGTSPVTSYLESITGISEGGRTGLCAVTVGFLFLFCLIFAPLVSLIPIFATAPTLILVGMLMMSDIHRIDFSDSTEALPAFLTIVGMPLTYNIVTGFSLGFISYCLLKSLTGQFRKISFTVWVIAFCFLLNFIITY